MRMTKTVLVAVLLVSASSFASPPATLQVDQKQFREPAFGDPKRKPELRVPGGAWGTTLSVPGGTQLVELELRERPNDRHPRQLLVDIEPGHRYRVGPDPCCFVAIADADATLRQESEGAICDGRPECVAPYTSVPSFVAQDPRCGEAHVCVRQSEVRFEVTASAAAAGALSVRFAGDASAFAGALDKVVGWQLWPWIRHDSPTSVEIWRGKTRLWARDVQLRLEHRYVIAVSGDGSQVTIQRQD